MVLNWQQVGSGGSIGCFVVAAEFVVVPAAPCLVNRSFFSRLMSDALRLEGCQTGSNNNQKNQVTFVIHGCRGSPNLTHFETKSSTTLVRNFSSVTFMTLSLWVACFCLSSI